jgi:hypothetical protein
MESLIIAVSQRVPPIPGQGSGVGGTTWHATISVIFILVERKGYQDHIFYSLIDYKCLLLDMNNLYVCRNGKF